MKKVWSILLCLIMLFLFVACSKQPANSITENDFLKTFDAMDASATITPVAVIDGNEKNQKIAAFTLKNDLSKNLSHMSITVDKNTSQILSIAVFSEWDFLLKADGSKEKQNNLGLFLFVNQAALALDPNLNVDKFEKEYTSAFKKSDGGLGEEDKFTYVANSSDQFEHILFTLK